jgi:hypothetical protein
MTILDERTAFPINYVKVRCDKSEGYCRLDELDIQPPKQRDWAYNFTIFWADVLFYRITQWSNDVIQEEYEGANACRSTIMDLNFKTKEFYLITKNTARDCQILGQKLDRLKKPRISQIVDGEQIITKEHQAFRRNIYEMLSSQFRAVIEKHQKSASE